MAAGAGVGWGRTGTLRGHICHSMPMVNCCIEQIDQYKTHNAAENTESLCSITHGFSSCVWLFLNAVDILLH